MGELDEISRAIGGMEATQIAILEGQKSQGEEIKEIRKAVVNQKVRSAYIAGGVGVGSSALVLLLKEKGIGIIKFFASGGGG